MHHDAQAARRRRCSCAVAAGPSSWRTGCGHRGAGGAGKWEERGRAQRGGAVGVPGRPPALAPAPGAGARGHSPPCSLCCEQVYLAFFVPLAVQPAAKGGTPLPPRHPQRAAASPLPSPLEAGIPPKANPSAAKVRQGPPRQTRWPLLHVARSGWAATNRSVPLLPLCAICAGTESSQAGGAVTVDPWKIPDHGSPYADRQAKASAAHKRQSVRGSLPGGAACPGGRAVPGLPRQTEVHMR